MSSSSGSFDTSSTNMYMENAIAAVQYVDDLHYSSNNREPERNGLSDEHGLTMEEHSKTIWSAVFKEMTKDIKFGQDDSAIGTLLANVATARIIGFANCEARAALAFLKLVEQGVQPVEQLSFVGKDHVALVIGRDQSTPFRDWTKWNESAIVCDPWLGKSFKINELAAQVELSPLLKDLVGNGPHEFSWSYRSTQSDKWPPKDLQSLCKKFNIG
jgi:hypothetical protein